jgi:acetyl/propionyl-CoA carboxylase alpha subunit
MSEHHLRDGRGPVRVRIAPNGDEPRVAIDDDPCAVARLQRGPRTHPARAITEPMSFDLDGVPVRALVSRLDDRVSVVIDGELYVFDSGAAADPPNAGRLGSGRINAPMPGKIIAVLVRPGDRVTVGQGVIVLEAMKMESTLNAEIDGTVAQVTAAAGDLVEGGVLLVEITPA